MQQLDGFVCTCHILIKVFYVGRLGNYVELTTVIAVFTVEFHSHENVQAPR